METIIGTVAIIAVIGLIGAVLLIIVSRVLAVEEDGRLAYLAEMLPGINCGGCGYAGCEAYAKAMLNGQEPNACTVGGDALAGDLAAFLGVEATGVIQKKAFVACQGSTDHIEPHFEFKGEPSCRAFSTMFFSSLSCSYGCLGFGDCAQACPYDAIIMKDGLARIDTQACTGCTTCVAICPRTLISMIEQNKEPSIALVACKNTMSGKKTREVCDIGCIGCKRCEKACPEDCITVENFLAKVDHSMCTGCEACIEVCPTNSIVKLNF